MGGKAMVDLLHQLIRRVAEPNESGSWPCSRRSTKVSRSKCRMETNLLDLIRPKLVLDGIQLATHLQPRLQVGSGRSGRAPE